MGQDNQAPQLMDEGETSSGQAEVPILGLPALTLTDGTSGLPTERTQDGLMRLVTHKWYRDIIEKKV